MAKVTFSKGDIEVMKEYGMTDAQIKKARKMVEDDVNQYSIDGIIQHFS